MLARHTAGSTVLTKEFRKINRALPAKVTKAFHDRALPIPESKIQQVVRDFQEQYRHLEDGNTALPQRTMWGRAANFEPMWNPEKLGAYLRQHLREDMPRKPDTGEFNRAVDRIVRDTKNDVRGAIDEADRVTDYALFNWRNTNADEMLGKMFFFHFWQSRQGGLYISEALKRPAVIGAYGRMMEEFQTQAEELGQPKYLTGFFQFQNSVAGFSTFFSPTDLVQSLLTFADWQYGTDEAAFKDVTALGQKWGTAPFLIHPALTMAAYSLGLLGPDAYAPALTGTETFGAHAIDILNLANAQGKLPSWVNEAGIGVDAEGNKVALPTRPLQSSTPASATPSPQRCNRSPDSPRLRSPTCRARWSATSAPSCKPSTGATTRRWRSGR